MDLSLVPPRPVGVIGGTATRRTPPTGVGIAPTLPLDRDLDPLSVALRVVGSETSVQVLWRLFWGARPFCELMRNTAGLSKKDLRLTLRTMRDDGLVTRRPAEEPGRDVEYALTPLGEALKPIVAAMYLWGLEHGRRRPAPLTDAPQARAAHAG